MTFQKRQVLDTADSAHFGAVKSQSGEMLRILQLQHSQHKPIDGRSSEIYPLTRGGTEPTSEHWKNVSRLIAARQNQSVKVACERLSIVVVAEQRVDAMSYTRHAVALK